MPLQKIAPDVKQELFTSVQNHFLWEDGEFWKSVLYAAVESELMRIYTPVSEGLFCLCSENS